VGPRACAPEHRQLLAECQVLKGDRAVSAADQCERSEHDDERGQHELSCRTPDPPINGLVDDLILAKHTPTTQPDTDELVAVPDAHVQKGREAVSRTTDKFLMTGDCWPADRSPCGKAGVHDFRSAVAKVLEGDRFDADVAGHAVPLECVDQALGRRYLAIAALEPVNAVRAVLDEPPVATAEWNPIAQFNVSAYVVPYNGPMYIPSPHARGSLMTGGRPHVRRA
jgi:hypothetical protein